MDEPSVTVSALEGKHLATKNGDIGGFLLGVEVWRDVLRKKKLHGILFVGTTITTYKGTVVILRCKE